MNELSDIGMALLAVIECIVTAAAYLLVLLVIPVACVMTLAAVVLFLIKLLGPLMGFLAACFLGIVIGVLLQIFTT